MKRLLLTVAIAASALFSAPVGAGQAFAYYDNPKMRHVVMLTHAPCPGKKAAQADWHFAVFSLYRGEIMKGCWLLYSSKSLGEVVSVCTLKADGNPLNGSCTEISKDLFIDADTLPRGATF